jgi:hypothetical protein
MMTIGVAPALYGTHVINAPRRETFEARRLGPYRPRRLLGTGGMGEVRSAARLSHPHTIERSTTTAGPRTAPSTTRWSTCTA